MRNIELESCRETHNKIQREVNNLIAWICEFSDDGRYGVRYYSDGFKGMEDLLEYGVSCKLIEML